MTRHHRDPYVHGPTDTEGRTSSWIDGRDLRRVAVLILAALVAAMSVVSSGSSSHSAPMLPGSIPEDLVAACSTDNPYLVTACYFTKGRTNQRDPPEMSPAIVAFNDTPNNQPRFLLARRDQIGAVWGLAYSGSEHALYAAAFQKRQIFFGSGGPGGIYRLDLSTGSVTQPITVTGAGSNRHDARPEIDRSARTAAAKNSLGGIDITADGSQLFVMNLADRSIHRFALPGGRHLGTIAHGAASEPWSEDARPFAVRVRGDHLYHGVVHSAESSQRNSDVQARVYESDLDGAGMREVLAVGLGYERGFTPAFSEVTPARGRPIPLSWKPWTDAGLSVADPGLRIAAYPQPVLSDIAFTPAGDIVLGLRDRTSDMEPVNAGFGNEFGGFGVGDILLGQRQGDRWVVDTSAEHFNDEVGLSDEIAQGALAAIAGSGLIVSSAWDPDIPQRQRLNDADVAIWYGAASGSKTRQEIVCRVSGPGARYVGESAPEDDEGYLAGTTVGDLEVLCPEAVPTETPSSTKRPTEPTAAPKSPTPTTTSSPTPTARPTETPDRAPLYLPILLREDPCILVRHAALAIVIDTSSSMLADAGDGRTKLEAAVEAVGILLAALRLPEDQAVVIGFDSDVTRHQLTSDADTLADQLSSLAPEPGTEIHLGVEAAHAELLSDRRHPENTPAMVLLTDGLATRGPEPGIAAAARAKADGISIFTIGLGPNVDAAQLRTMASRPDWFYVAPEPADLEGAYATIARNLPCPPDAYWGGR